MQLSPETEKTFLKIYIGQNIRNEGILKTQIMEMTDAQDLLSEGLIRENRWYKFTLFLTTDKGGMVGREIVNREIEANRDRLIEKMKLIPRKTLGFFNRRYIARNLAFSAERDSFNIGRYLGSWEDSIVGDGRIWTLWNQFFAYLMSLGLCVKTYAYVSTRGGETRDPCYVISPEMRELLVTQFGTSDFTLDEEMSLRVHSFLILAKRILAAVYIDDVRWRYYESLKASNLTENQVAAIVNEMSKMKITSEYRGLLSEKGPFDIINTTSYDIFLSDKIIEPAVSILLSGAGRIGEFHAEKKMPSLAEVKTELGLLDDTQIGDFYVMVSKFERELREFIKGKLGKDWEKRIDNDCPRIYEAWSKRRDTDSNWGMDPEKELMNYANPEHYISIVKKYSEIFSDEPDDLSLITAQLKTWRNQGRNPLMHCRTVTEQKFFTSKSAMEFLKAWIRRKTTPL